MAFEWTSHRFSGGLLALDLVNTVVCRSDPARRADRFADLETVKRFADAAGRLRADEAGNAALAGPSTAEEQVFLVALREAVDNWLRPQAAGLPESGHALARLFSAAADCCKDDGTSGAIPVGQAAAVSAMRLMDPAIRARVKICPDCDWLFADQSKNRSRLWCDMAVCGNRAKARAHYRRRTAGAPAGEGR